MLNPFLLVGLGLDLDAAKDIIGEVRLQRGSEVALVSTLDPERSSVLLLLNIHSPVAFVKKTDLLLALLSRLHIHGYGQSIGERVIETVE